jgi:glycosyltransferase involved in cell wall biosynthesis
MPHVQFVLPDLGYNAAAKQVSLIAPGIVEPGWATEVYSLAGGGPFAEPLRAADVPVRCPTAHPPLDWFGLRWAIPATGHGIVHAFGMPVLRRLWAATVRRRRPPVVLSLTCRERLSRFDRHCLGIVSRVVVHHHLAADALIRQGVPAGRISVIPPAVASFDAPRRMPSSTLCVDEAAPPNARIDAERRCVAFDAERQTRIPEGAFLLATAGSMPDRHRLFPAVWAFEFIRYPHENAHLLVIGGGPGRADMASVARKLAPEGSRIHFLNERSNAPQLLAAADIVLVLHRWGGVNAALEAMAAGRPVVAANTPELAAIIRDGETGRLVPVRDAAAAAGVIRKLILDPAERRRLGDAARAFVRQHCSVETVVPMLETIYEEEFTSTRSSLWAE